MIDELGLSTMRVPGETIQESRLRTLYKSRAIAGYGHNEMMTTNQRVEMKKNQAIRKTGRVGMTKRENLRIYPDPSMVRVPRAVPGIPERGFGAVLQHWDQTRTILTTEFSSSGQHRMDDIVSTIQHDFKAPKDQQQTNTSGRINEDLFPPPFKYHKRTPQRDETLPPLSVWHNGQTGRKSNKFHRHTNVSATRSNEDWKFGSKQQFLDF